MCKFNPMAFATTDKYDAKNKPGMAGVRHENGYKVASDSHILCALKESYPEDLEGKTMRKDGTTNSDRFPRWREVIPTKGGRWMNLNNYESFEIDFAKVREFKKEVKQLQKDERLAKKAPVYVKIGPALFKLDMFEKLASLMKYIGTNKVMVNGPQRAAFVTENENYGLLMPCYLFGGSTENEMIGNYYMNRVFTLA